MLTLEAGDKFHLPSVLHFNSSYYFLTFVSWLAWEDDSLPNTRGLSLLLGNGKKVRKNCLGHFFLKNGLPVKTRIPASLPSTATTDVLIQSNAGQPSESATAAFEMKHRFESVSNLVGTHKFNSEL